MEDIFTIVNEIFKKIKNIKKMNNNENEIHLNEKVKELNEKYKDYLNVVSYFNNKIVVFKNFYLNKKDNKLNIYLTLDNEDCLEDHYTSIDYNHLKMKYGHDFLRESRFEFLKIKKGLKYFNVEMNKLDNGKSKQ